MPRGFAKKEVQPRGRYSSKINTEVEMAGVVLYELDLALKDLVVRAGFAFREIHPKSLSSTTVLQRVVGILSYFLVESLSYM